MLELAGKGSFEACKSLALKAIENKSALAKFKEMIENQNGVPDVVHDVSLLPRAVHTREYPSPDTGYLASLTSDSLGTASMLLGAGRASKESMIDHAAGIVLLKKPGDKVQKNEPLMVLHANDASLFDAAVQQIDRAIAISRDKPKVSPLILDIIE